METKKSGQNERFAFNELWAERSFSGKSSGLYVEPLVYHTANNAEIYSNMPFSFKYGGRRSQELIANWEIKTERADKTDENLIIRTLILNDPKTSLEVKAVCTLYTDTSGIDWTLYLTNKGTADTPHIKDLKALDFSLKLPERSRIPVLHRLVGGENSDRDWMPFDTAIPMESKVEMSPTGGKSSANVCPFFNLEWEGGGFITAIGWSGQWEAAVGHNLDGILDIQVGIQDINLILKPGESIRSPRILLLFWDGSEQFDAYNQFRKIMFRHIMPKIDGEPVFPPIVHLSTAFYEMNDSTESDVLSHLESIKGLGFEYFWLDAYWSRGGVSYGIGNYGIPLKIAEAEDRFPKGLKPISIAVHENGMKFVLWFEPERVSPGTFIAREHPEFCVWHDQLGHAQLATFDLGNEEARKYMTGYLIAAIKEYGMDCLRIDFNYTPLNAWSQKDSLRDWNQKYSKYTHRKGISQIRYCEGLYKMWDDILKEFPHLFIDNCASGGQRIDLETSARSIPLWRTDATIRPLMEKNYNQAALQNQVMTAGLNRYLPYSTSGAMGASPYHFRSGFNAGIAFCEDCRVAGYPLEQLRQGIEEGKRIRKYFSGDFYALSKVTADPFDWCVMQYHRPDEGDGVIMAFRRHESPYGSFVCLPQAIDPRATFEITKYYSYEPEKTYMIEGSELQHIKIELVERPGSLIIEYRGIKQ